MEIRDDLAIIGCKDGNVLVYQISTAQSIATHFLLGDEISAISSKSQRTTLGGNSNHLMSWKTIDNELFDSPPDVILMDGYTKSLYFEETGQEGLASTSAGTI